MKPPKYPLQTVLDQRGRAKESAKKALAQAMQEVQREQQKLKELETKRQTLLETRADRVAHLYDPDEKGMLSIPAVEQRKNGIQHIDYAIKENDAAIEAQKQVVQQAEQKVEERKSELIEADKALKAIEKHREKWFNEWKLEMQQKEQKLGEEIALARFVRDRAETAEEEGE
ncbi:MAG: flagellar export protein FliJ [Acidobacteriota bacterium]